MPDTHLSGPVPTYAIHPGYQSQNWYPCPCVAIGAAAMTNNLLRLMPYPVSFSLYFDAIGVLLTTAGTDAGATTRLGVYNSDVNGYPAGLLVDAGTFPSGTGQSTGAKQIVFPAPIYLTAGLYWLAFCNQNAPGTAPAVSLIQSMDAIQLPFPVATQPYALGGDLSAVTGALPATTGIVTFTAQTIPRVMLRAL